MTNVVIFKTCTGRFTWKLACGHISHRHYATRAACLRRIKDVGFTVVEAHEHHDFNNVASPHHH